MKVRDLIARLRQMDPEAEVWVNKYDGVDAFEAAEDVFATVETRRDYSKKYDDPDAYPAVDSVRIY